MSTDLAKERERMTFMKGYLTAQLENAGRLNELKEVIVMLSEHDPKCPGPRECWCMDAAGIAEGALCDAE